MSTLCLGNTVAIFYVYELKKNIIKNNACINNIGSDPVLTNKRGSRPQIKYFIISAFFISWSAFYPISGSPSAIELFWWQWHLLEKQYLRLKYIITILSIETIIIGIP